jgi:hypothetical protein
MLKVGIILVGVLGAIVLVLGILLKSAYEDLGSIEARYEAQRQETIEANRTIDRLQLDHERQLHALKLRETESKHEAARLRKETRNIREKSSGLERAIKEQPGRAGRVTSYLVRRGMREVCRASGGDKDQCRVEIPQSATPGPSDTSKPDDRPERVSP